MQNVLIQTFVYGAQQKHQRIYMSKNKVQGLVCDQNFDSDLTGDVCHLMKAQCWDAGSGL